MGKVLKISGLKMPSVDAVKMAARPVTLLVVAPVVQWMLDQKVSARSGQCCWAAPSWMSWLAEPLQAAGRRQALPSGTRWI